MTASPVTLLPLGGLPLIERAGELEPALCRAIAAEGGLRAGDVVVVAQKVVSKSEDRYVVLDEVEPGPEAVELATRCGKDPRLVQVVLDQSERVIRCVPGVLIVRHRRGFVMANAGVDQSNVAPLDGRARALLLPEDADASAARLRAALREAFGVEAGVIVSDSFGRAWRVGTTGVAIGSAGVAAVRDLRGAADLFGRPLQVTQIALADELAAAASLLMGQAAERVPAVIVRGIDAAGDGGADALLRPPEEDLFL